MHCVVLNRVWNNDTVSIKLNWYLYVGMLCFRYKKPEERGSLNQAMTVLLPLAHQRCVQLVSDQSEHSVLLQKQILKVFYALIQVSYHLITSI